MATIWTGKNLSLQEVVGHGGGQDRPADTVLTFEADLYSKRPLDAGVKTGCAMLFNQGLDNCDPSKGVPAEKHPRSKTIEIDSR